MSENDEAFLSRWSRLKREQAQELAKPAEPATPAPALPEVEKLTSESDFTGFMHPKVKDELRRVALKKLFSDAHFNIPDPFEAYSGDWTGGDPIPPELLEKLNQARTVLFREDEKKEEKKPEAVAGAEKQPEAKPDEPGRQDA